MRDTKCNVPHVAPGLGGCISSSHPMREKDFKKGAKIKNFKRHHLEKKLSSIYVAMALARKSILYVG